MCRNEFLFSSFTYSNTLSTVTLVDCTKTAVKGIDQTTPTSSLSLNYVYMSLIVLFDLILVSSSLKPLIAQSPSLLTFFVYMTGVQGGQLVLGMSRHYHLAASSPPVACTSITSPELLHHRLGHPSLSKFKKLVPSLSFLSIFNCESC